MRVTMVDDSAADRKLCRILLEGKYGRNLEFVEAATAAAGLEAYQSRARSTTERDCLLLDYKLPDMNGLEFLNRLHQQAGRALGTIAVVMLTGLGNERVAAAAIKAGVQDYLVKDRITSESLQMALENALEKVSLVGALKAERDELARSLAEKDVLLREVHHRVKNNLQVIASLLRLQAASLDGANTEDSAAARALRDSRNRVESMALIHEQLYATPSSEHESLRRVDLASFSSGLVRNLMHAYGMDSGRIECRVNIETIKQPVDRAIPVGLILNELLSNALRHAFPENRRGSLWIEGSDRDGWVELEVRDDGSGIPAETKIIRAKDARI